MQNHLPYNEKELLLQVAKGDEQSFAQLFRHWQPFLATHIYRITQSTVLAEEIVQDVFLKIWQTRDTLSDIHNFKGYLLVVSKNHALNALQKVAREFHSREKWVKENNAMDESPDRKAVYYSLIDEAIDQLSERQRQAYLLHRHERLTYQQIADRLGIGKESVKTHISLAVKQISAYVRGRLGLAVMILLLLG